MVTDHTDAWDLAHFKQENSNFARCYIDLRKTVSRLLSGDTPEATRRLREIDATVKDGIVRVSHG